MKSFGSFTFAVILVLMGCSSGPGGAADPERISREKLLSHVEILSSDEFQGRQTGTESGLRAAGYVQDQMEGMRLMPCTENLKQTFDFTSRRSSETADGINLVGLVPGTGSSDRTIVVTAHFDHLGVRNGEVFNGADDNASGIGALLELARYFVTHPAEHSIVFAGLDAEEMGLRGAQALVASDCITGRNVTLNINMDMISRSEAGELYVAGTSHTPSLVSLIESLPVPEGVELKIGHDLPGTGREDWTFSSDHGPFFSAGIPFLYFGVEDHPGYHNPTDDFENITPDFYFKASNLILDAVLAADGDLDSLQGE